MAVAQTSMEAVFGTHRKQSKVAQQDRVLQTLKRWKRGRTNAELAAVLKLPASTVAARVNMLKQLGRVEAHSRRRCTVTGYSATVHRVAQ